MLFSPKEKGQGLAGFVFVIAMLFLVFTALAIKYKSITG